MPTTGAAPLAALALLLALWALNLSALLSPSLLPPLPLPSAYWALAAPALLVALVCSYGLAYGCLALARNPPLSALGALWDGHSIRAPPPPSAFPRPAFQTPAPNVSARCAG